MLIILLKVNVERSVLSDLTKALSTIELELEVRHIVAIGGVPFAIKLPYRYLLRAVLHFFREELKLIGDQLKGLS